MNKITAFLSKFIGVIKSRIANGKFLYEMLSSLMPVLVKVFGMTTVEYMACGTPRANGSVF